jgi:hypothetical protein
MNSIEMHGESNAKCVTVGKLQLHFSYKTLIAFYTPETGRVVRMNDWRNTTGKHLNQIDGGDQKNRLSGEEFDRKVSAMLKKHRLEI